MSTFLLLTVTGLGLGAMYFLIASGLSLIYGLMGVLNFAHGAFITVGSYGTWWASVHVFDGVHSSLWRFLLSALLGLLCGGAFAALVELVLIRPLYSRHIEQVLVTVGLQLAFVALVIGGLGSIGGSAVAAVLVGLTQQYTNYYASSGVGDMIVVLLLGVVLLTRPRGIAGAVVGARA